MVLLLCSWFLLLLFRKIYDGGEASLSQILCYLRFPGFLPFHGIYASLKYFFNLSIQALADRFTADWDDSSTDVMKLS